LLMEFHEGKETEVYVHKLSTYVKALILEGPEDFFAFVDDDGDTIKKVWSMICNLYIKKNDVEKNEHYGIYRATCQWDRRNERWRIRNFSYGNWLEMNTRI